MNFLLCALQPVSNLWMAFFTQAAGFLECMNLGIQLGSRLGGSTRWEHQGVSTFDDLIALTPAVLRSVAIACDLCFNGAT